MVLKQYLVSLVIKQRLALITDLVLFNYLFMMAYFFIQMVLQSFQLLSILGEESKGKPSKQPQQYSPLVDHKTLIPGV